MTAPAWAANNCPTFFDYRNTAVVTVVATVGQNAYSPKCVRIAQGGSVRFTLNFGSHPTLAGLVPGGGGNPIPDPSSPIGSQTSGSTVDIRFDQAGEFPYFCDFHWDNGMMGSVLVDPVQFADGFE
jgi:plastocyanin